MTLKVEDLAKLTKAQLREKCKEVGVPYSGTDTVDDMRNALAAKLSEAGDSAAVDADGDGVADAVVTKADTKEAEAEAEKAEIEAKLKKLEQLQSEKAKADAQEKAEAEAQAKAEEIEGDDLHVPQNINCQDPKVLGIAIAIEQGREVPGFTYVPKKKVPGNHTVRPLKCTKVDNSGREYQLCKLNEAI